MATLLAALLAGLGGLLLETVLVRRHALLLGSTAEAAALVLAAYLLGLGLGARLSDRMPGAAARPGRAAAKLYLIVALAAPLCDVALRVPVAVSWPIGVVLTAITPGLLAVAMGAAFPLLLAATAAGPWRTGGLVGANLLGSVVAAWAAGNVVVPGIGLTETTLLGAGAYLGASVLAGRAPARHRLGGVIRRPPPLRRPAQDAFWSGVLVLGLQMLLLRRLPFWLEGFQPTLAGVLAACLLALAAGATFGTPLLARFGRQRAALVALVLGAVSVAVAPHEWLVPKVASWPVNDTAGMHLRIAVAALAAAGVPCFLLGAVVPLHLARLRHEASRVQLAGRLLFWQGVGGLAGALLVEEAMPALFPRAFLVAAPIGLAALVLLALLPRGWTPRLALPAVVVVALVGVGNAGSLLHPEPPLRGARYDRPEQYRYLGHAADSLLVASAVYDRRSHSTLLFTDGFRAAETGPGTDYMRALGHLPMLLHGNVRRAAVIAFGTGTTAAAVCQWPQPERIDIVEISKAVLSLAEHFAADGPVVSPGAVPAFLRDPRTRLHVTDGRRYLAHCEPGSLDLVTLEPLLPYAPGTAALYSAEFYAIARRALAPGGLLVQWVPTHALPAESFETLLATFAAAFPHTSTWLVDQATLLVGSVEPHLPSQAVLAERYAALPEAVRGALHAAGLATPDDLQVALLGEATAAAAGNAPVLHDDRPFLERVDYWSGLRKLAFYPDNLRRLQAVVEASAQSPALAAVRRWRLQGLEAHARAASSTGNDEARAAVEALARACTEQPDSVLLHREETLALRTLLEREAILRGGQGMAALARNHLQRDPRSALLWACAALPDGGTSQAARTSAAERAAVLDPVLFEDGPAFVQEVRPTTLPPSPLEDLGVLPQGDALAAAALVGVRGFALRTVHPVKVGRALVRRLAERPLTAEEADALRPLLDPHLLALAASAVAHRGGDVVAEIAPLWRTDLPMPTALQSALDQGTAARQALAVALAGHRGARARAALSALLMDEELTVRTAAAVSLFDTHGDRVPYDPQWDESRRRRAAAQLR